MAAAVYLLCALSSLACALLLLRSYRESRARFLLWSTLCFGGLALSNAFLFVDLVILPDLDLFVYRQLVTLTSVLALVWGFVWDTR